MRLKAHHSDIDTYEPIVMMNGDDCLNLGVGAQDRVRIGFTDSAVSKVVISDTVAKKGIIYIPRKIMERCGASDGDLVDVTYHPAPESVKSIKRKINGEKLTGKEILSIVSDIMDRNLSDMEIIAFVSSFNVNNSDMEEIASLTDAMASTGKRLSIRSDRIFDFHSLGGVPGNKITPIVVSIVASEGFTMPKMSSRAVSSACGTSDFVDTFCDVEMLSEDIPGALERTNGLFFCGNEEFAPVGSIIIEAERPLGIDPRPMMMASIMSKKVSVGSTHLLLDIPMGEGTKIQDIGTARRYAEDFRKLGDLLGMKVCSAITNAEQPIGTAIGPVLEARECLRILETGEGDRTVIDKACGIAGMLLEMAGLERGAERARESIASGRALERFRDIVEVQNGDRNISSKDLVPGRFSKDVHAKRSGFVQFIDNDGMAAIAKGAGAPADIGAGIVLMHKKGDAVSKGDVLFTIYAENEAKLARSVESARSRMPMLVNDCPVSTMHSMIIEKM